MKGYMGLDVLRTREHKSAIGRQGIGSTEKEGLAIDH